LHIPCLNYRYSGGKGEKKGAAPTKATTQKDSKQEHAKNTCKKCNLTSKKRVQNAEKKTPHNFFVLYNANPSAQTIVCAHNIAQQAFYTASRPPSTLLGFVVFRQKTRKRPPRV